MKWVDPMRALTIWQPYASLIMVEAKPYEFRSWEAPAAAQNTRIVIHAAVRVPTMREMVDSQEWAMETHGKSLGGGMTDLAKAMDLYDRWKRSGRPDDVFPRGVGLGTAKLGVPIKASEISEGLWPEDTWAWPLTDIKPFDKPVPARGYQGFWRWYGGKK